MEHKSTSLSTIEELQKAVRELNEKIEELKQYASIKSTEQAKNEDSQKELSERSNQSNSTSDVNSPTGSNEMSPVQLKESHSGKEEETKEKLDPEPSVEFGIFVSDIARGVTDEQLTEAFSIYGKVFEAKVVKNKFTGETKGYGFVRFHNMNDVYKVLDSKNLPKFEDNISHRLQVVKVQFADPKNTLYLNNLPKEMSLESLQNKITELGQAKPTKFDLHVTSDSKPKGYGWVSYENHEVAVKVMKNLQEILLQGSPISVSLAEPKAIDRRIVSSTKVLFVKGLADSVDEKTLSNLFGEELIEKVVIPLDQVQQTRIGHAFVHFKQREDAEMVKSKFEGYILANSELKIEWCIPQHAKKHRTKNRKKKNNQNESQKHLQNSNTYYKPRDFGTDTNQYSHDYIDPKMWPPIIYSYPSYPTYYPYYPYPSDYDNDNSSNNDGGRNYSSSRPHGSQRHTPTRDRNQFNPY